MGRFFYSAFAKAETLSIIEPSPQEQLIFAGCFQKKNQNSCVMISGRFSASGTIASGRCTILKLRM